MGETTSIAWCNMTFNPWIGCEKVSSGCKNCYASVDTYARVSASRGLPLWGPGSTRHRTSKDNWKNPRRWNKAARAARLAAEAKGEPYERPRVFCASLCDVFEGRADLDPWRADLWGLIEECDELDWMLLTKRPENIQAMVPERWRAGLPEHIWIGTSVEGQDAANERIPHLAQVRARIRFLSCEPLLGPVNIGLLGTCPQAWGYGYRPVADLIHLIIIGGEGNGGRRCDIAWIRDLVTECRDAGVAPFVKQLGSAPSYDTDGPGGTHAIDLIDKKGGDPSEWPSDLRVREMPVRAM